MKKPVRLRLSRRAGFDLQQVSKSINGLPGLNCSRPGWAGNPFKIGEGAPFRFTGQGGFYATKALRAITDAETAVRFFRAWINSHHGAQMRKRLQREARGKNLFCWCSAGQACHVDVELEIANVEDQ